MKIDIIAFDAEGKEVLIALIQEDLLPDDEAANLMEELRETQLPARFGLVGDLEKIRIVNFAQPVESGFNCILNTGDILRRYDPEFGTKRIFQRYLRVLVEAWLRDIAFRWESNEPPALEALTEIGLAMALEDGDTRSEVVIETDSVR